MRSCLVCDKDISAKHKGAKYCSTACSNKGRIKPSVAKKCKLCGTEFNVPYMKRSRTFCSKSCSTKFTNLHRNEEEVRARISETKKRQYAIGEVVHPWIGKKHSDKTKSKISQTRIERGVAAGENNPMFGKNHSKMTCEKISETRSRRITNGDYDSWFKKGSFVSKKMNRELPFRSSWEEKVMRFLECSADVLLYDFEPFSIPYRHGTDNHKRHYIPDFLVVFEGGDRKLIEVKPEYFLEAEINQAKFAAAREYCKKHGILFEVWTENTIKTLLTEEVI